MLSFRDNVFIAIEALKMNKMRALLTMLGIIIGIGSVITIDTVGSSLTGSVSDSMSSLGANAITVSLTEKSSEDTTDSSVQLSRFRSDTPKSTDLITDTMIDEYKNTFKDDVKYVETTINVGTGTVPNGDLEDTSITVMGTDSLYHKAEDINLLYGRFIDNDKDGNRKVCVVSDKFIEDTLSAPARNTIGQEITITVNNIPFSFFIEGVYEYENDTASSSKNSEENVTTEVYIPLETARIISGADRGYESVTVITSADTDTSRFMNITGDYFASYYTHNDKWTCEATSMETMVETMTEMIDSISLAIAAVAAISLIVGGIGVMNIMLVSITERTKEIGTRKALGASNSAIRMQFITEAMMICLAGGIIGVLLGVGLGAIISVVIGYSAKPSVISILSATGFSMFIGVLFGYAPANKAANLTPIEALRHE